MDNEGDSDPFSQAISLETPKGQAKITLPYLDQWITYKVQISINYGAQIGASMGLLMVLLLLTKPNKRRSILFVINALSLTLNLVRNVLLCIYFTGPFTKTYAYFGHDYSKVTKGDYATSITASAFEVLVIVCIEISLCIQVHVVCANLQRCFRHVLLTCSALNASTAITLRFVLTAENTKYILRAQEETSMEQLSSISNIVTTVSICWYSAIFVLKLAFALYRRRKLGMTQFGPMQALFIMGCQTMILPAMFSILQYFVHNPAMSSNVLTAAAISLPLSSLWASASADSHTPDLGVSECHCGKRGSGKVAVFQSTESKSFRVPISPSNTETTV